MLLRLYKLFGNSTRTISTLCSRGICFKYLKATAIFFFLWQELGVYPYLTRNNSFYLRNNSSSQVQHMVNRACGPSILFHTGPIPSQLAHCQKIKEETQQKESLKHRATSKLEKSFFKRSSPKTTSNTGRGEWGRERAVLGSCTHARRCVCACVCVYASQQSCRDASRLCWSNPSVEKKKRLSALIKSLECVCVSSRSGRPLQHPESTSAQRLPRR